MTSQPFIWQCPDCKKEFAKTNQSHKCEVVDIDTLFARKDPELKKLYDYFWNRVKKIGDCTETTSSKAITIYTANKKAFMGITPKKAWLDIWFNLKRRIDEFPVYQVVQPSKTKYGHFVRLHSKEDIDDTLMKWLKESYTDINE